MIHRTRVKQANRYIIDACWYWNVIEISFHRVSHLLNELNDFDLANGFNVEITTSTYKS